MRVLITGGSGAIGAALVKQFAPDFEVVFTYLHSLEKAAALEKETGAAGIKCDVRDRAKIAEITDEYPYFDVLINNAGISQIKLFGDISPDEWEQMLAVNLTGAFNVTSAVLPAMLRRKRGFIVNISSIWGEVGASCEVHYSAAKAGLIGFSRALAKEVAPSGITVRCLTPGAVESPMTEGFSAEELKGAADFNKGGKILTPEDIAKEVRGLFD